VPIKVTNLVRSRVSLGRREAVLVEVQTDAGIRGFGEAVTDGCPQTVLGVLRDWEPTLKGADASRIEEFCRRAVPLHTKSSPSILRTAGAIEAALWDIKGKALKTSVTQCFGGAVRERIRVCARDLPEKPEEFARAAECLVAQGITAVRWRPEPERTGILRRGYLESLVSQMQRVRQAMGADVDIVCDLAGVPSPALARQIGCALEPLRPCLVADPCTPADVQTLARLTGEIKVPICGGPGGRRPDQLPFLQARALSAVWLDPGACGGMAEARQIAAAAEIHYTPVVASYGGCWAAPAPAWHLATMIPNLLFLELPYDEILWRTGLPHPFRVERGYLNIPEGPGLGAEPDLEAIRRAGGSVTIC
jgi:galactonate dehydratase